MFTNSLPFMAWGVHFSLFTFRCSLIRFYQYKKTHHGQHFLILNQILNAKFYVLDISLKIREYHRGIFSDIPPF